MSWAIYGTPEIVYRSEDGRIAIYEVVVGEGTAELEFLGFL
jgi:hypothetical protein